MSKKNNLPSIPDYTGDVKNTERMIVQKSNLLKSLSQTSMTLSELKILDIYLAHINSHEPDKCYVRFEKGELERLLGVTRMHREELTGRLKNLFQVIEIRDERKPKGFKCISLFEKAECTQDENGLWQVNLMCTTSAMEYIFNIENIEYFKYRLKNVINLTSKYSYILYLYLEDNQNVGSSKKWEIDLDELKKIMNCTAESYSKYKEFNDKILKKCQKEINQKTTLNFTYISVKRGRKVVSIIFNVKKQKNIETTNEKPNPKELTVVSDYADEPKPKQMPISVYDEELDEESIKYYESFDKYLDDDIRFLAEACHYEFTEAQMKEIYNIISTMNLPSHPYGKDFSQYDYLSDQYIKLDKYSKDKGMDNKRKFSYFRRMIENDRRNY
ncbi:MAG: replication initiation protein [Ruminococcus sp.]|nr:replication initiation protein [Ruminococcus sp.]